MKQPSGKVHVHAAQGCARWAPLDHDLLALGRLAPGSRQRDGFPAGQVRARSASPCWPAGRPSGPQTPRSCRRASAPRPGPMSTTQSAGAGWCPSSCLPTTMRVFPRVAQARSRVSSSRWFVPAGAARWTASSRHVQYAHQARKPIWGGPAGFRCASPPAKRGRRRGPSRQVCRARTFEQEPRARALTSLRMRPAILVIPVGQVQPPASKLGQFPDGQRAGNSGDRTCRPRFNRQGHRLEPGPIGMVGQGNLAHVPGRSGSRLESLSAPPECRRLDVRHHALEAGVVRPAPGPYLSL